MQRNLQTQSICLTTKIMPCVNLDPPLLAMLHTFFSKKKLGFQLWVIHRDYISLALPYSVLANWYPHYVLETIHYY